ncbi:MAG: polysaccharide biosynthesis tyrosine autokinase [Acidimicrobiia bacterium]|nr:polysaccharide biosynthesis tyrosine autokinase [Acidimicrobiia bacterium]
MTEYTGVVRRWRGALAVIAALGAVIGTVLVALDRGTYTAEAVVQVRPIVSQSDEPNLDSNRQISAETEEAVAGSQRVAERALGLRVAAEQLGTTDLASSEVIDAARGIAVGPEEARRSSERLEVSILPDSQILVLTATGDDPETVSALAQSSAVAYLEFRRDEATIGNGESRQRLAAREAELVAELDALDDELGAVPADGVLAYAEVAKRQELTVIGTTFANLESLSVNPGVILTDAAVPTSPDGLPLAAGPLLGTLLGLVAGLTGVFVIDRTDDRLRSTGFDAGVLGVPLLGTAPVASRQAGIGGVFPVNTAGSDAYRRLQGTLLFNLDSLDRTVVLVAGVNDAAAATAVAANIGATAARAGRRTLVVGADLRNDALGRHLGVAEGSGLSDVILGDARLGESITPVDGVENLGVLQAGTRLDRPTSVLQSSAFGRLMAAVQADYDLVVVEVPPVLDVADAVDVAGLCDAAVVVAEAGAESRQEIIASVEQLKRVGSDIVGLIVADVG